MDWSGMALRRGQAAVLQQAFQAALATARLIGVLRAHIAADILFLLFDVLGLSLKFGQTTGITLLALMQISRVIAAINFERGRHLPDHAGGLVEKVAIM